MKTLLICHERAHADARAVNDVLKGEGA